MQAKVVEGVEPVGEAEERDVPALDLHEVPAAAEAVGAADGHEAARGRHRPGGYFRAAGVSVVSRRSPLRR